MNEKAESFNCWAVVELFGHQQIAGKVSEQTIAGQGFIRVDVPEDERHPAYTRLLGHGAIYSIIPTSEEIVRAFSRKNYQVPIYRYQLTLPDPKDESGVVAYEREADSEVIPF